jgi:hypothetical protein
MTLRSRAFRPRFSAVVLWVALAACRPPVPSRPTPREPATPFEREGRAVVIFDAVVQSGPGSGPLLGTVAAGTVVGLGRVEGEWRQIEIEGPVRATAWIPSERIGCRALRDVELAPLDGSKPQVLLRPGALLAVTATDGDRLDVETQGSIAVRGRIAASDCGVGRPFVPTLPRDGNPSVLTRDAFLTTDVAGGGSSIRLPAGQRFAVFLTRRADRNVAYGRTDGPVVLRGSIDALSLARDTSTPFDRLAEPLGYTHEALLGATLLDAPEGGAIAEVAAGTPLNVGDREGSWARITTHGAVRLEGWIEGEQIRRVSLDHNTLDPEARRRDHSPVERDRLLGLDTPADDE